MARPLEKELRTLKQERKRLEREHIGKFVLIHKDEVVGTYDDFETAAHEGIRRFGSQPFLIRRIGKDEADLSPAVMYGLTGANSTNVIR